MKWLWLWFGIILATTCAYAQQGNTVTIRFAGAPSGSCSPVAYAINNATGAFYDCLSGSWNLVGGAGAGVDFSAITSGTNTTAAMVVGTGASLASVPQFNIGAAGTSGVLGLLGTTSGTATLTAPAVAGTTTNAVVSSNVIRVPVGAAATASIQLASADTGIFSTAGFPTFVVGGVNILSARAAPNIASLGSAGMFAWTSASVSDGTVDTGVSRCGGALYICFGNGAASDKTAVTKSGMSKILTADWTCGTGGTVSSCVAAQTIGTLTFTLPLVAANWSFNCELVVGQATGATANNWSLQTATNGATNTMAAFIMDSAATAITSGAITGQGSTTSSFDITGTWTLGGTATKMPAHIFGTLEGVSASGTVFNLQLKAPTVADLVTIYRGSKCTLDP